MPLEQRPESEEEPQANLCLQGPDSKDLRVVAVVSAVRAAQAPERRVRTYRFSRRKVETWAVDRIEEHGRRDGMEDSEAAPKNLRCGKRLADCT